MDRIDKNYDNLSWLTQCDRWLKSIGKKKTAINVESLPNQFNALLQIKKFHTKSFNFDDFSDYHILPPFLRRSVGLRSQ